MNFSFGPTQNQPIMSNNDQRNQIHLSQIKKVMEGVYTLQNQHELHYLIQYLQRSQDAYSKQIDECFKDEGITKHDQEFMRQVRQRCHAMKQKNEFIMMELFNLKQKITRMMYMSLEKDHTKETQLNLVQQKIRRTKMQISNKLQELKAKKMLKKQNSESVQRHKNIKYQSLKTPLVQLKNATQIVDKELIRQREEIKILVKQLYGDEI